MAYEAGFKSQWFENRLRFNANGYYSDYTDMHVTVWRAGQQTGAQSSLENAGKSEIWGSEFEVVAIPLRGLELAVNYGLTLANFEEYLEQALDPITGQPILDSHGNSVLQNVAKQRDFLFIPDHSVSVGATNTAPTTSSGTFSAHLDMYGQSPVALDPVVPSLSTSRAMPSSTAACSSLASRCSAVVSTPRYFPRTCSTAGIAAMDSTWDRWAGRAVCMGHPVPSAWR